MAKKSEALPLDKLHPYYIEICRRRRLFINSNGIFAIKLTSAGMRLATKNYRGVVGDPWQLVDKRDKKGDKALAMQKDGFSYQRIVGYLFEGGDWALPALFYAKPTDKFLLARGVKGDRGGETEGYYERIIPISQKVKSAMMRGASTQELGDIAKARMDEVGKVQGILRHSIAVFASYGDGKNAKKILRARPQDNLLRKKVDEWVDKLDEIVDATFFDDLQNEFEADASERQAIRDRWLLNDANNNGVINHARKILHDAEDALPCNEIQRYRARVRADSVFEGSIRGNDGLPFLFEREEEDQAWQSTEQTTQEQNPTGAQMTLFE